MRSDSNTIAEIQHDLAQGKTDRDAEMLLEANREYIQQRAHERLCVDFGQASDLAMEAIHGEGFEKSDYFLIATLLSAIEHATNEDARQAHRAMLGAHIETKILDYLRDEFVRQAEDEVLSV